MLFILSTLFLRTLLQFTNLKPYSFLLIVMGLIMGIIYNSIDSSGDLYSNSIDYWINMHPHNFLLIFLPPLIYQSSFLIDYHIFSKTIYLIITLGFIGVITSCLFTAGFIYGIDNDFQNTYSLMLGSILSATDPIAVIAILNELRLSHKLSILIEGESLLNDGITIIIFNVIMDILLKSPTVESTIGNIFRLLFGGLIIGCLLTLIKMYILKKIYNNVFAETTITFVFCYLIYYLAEFTKLHTSGILALVVSGLCMAAYGNTRISPNSKQTLKDFWNLLSSSSNMIIFTLSGIIITTKISFSEISYIHWIILFSLYFYINIVRTITCLCLYPFLKNNIYHYDHIDFFIISLSGLRGEISLALALFVNLETQIPENIRNLTMFYTCGIVFLTILINSNIINYVIHYYHRDKISITKNTMKLINNNINNDGVEYVSYLEKNGFHMKKANYEFIKNTLIENIVENIVEDDVVIDTNLEEDNQIIIHVIQQQIWKLFDQHYLHYEIDRNYQ